MIPREAELLLFPGMGQDERAYEWVRLPPSRTYVYPGHGDRPPRPVTLGDLADEAMAGVAVPIDIVGVALGGIVAQHVLARHGNHVRSAVLANTPGGVTDPKALIARAEATRAHGPDVDELLARWLRPTILESGRGAVDYLRTTLEALSREGLANIQLAMADHDVRDALANDPHPVTFVVGEDDRVGVGATERLSTQFPNSRIRRIAGGHMVHLDNPEGFREVVEEHLAWVSRLDQDD